MPLERAVNRVPRTTTMRLRRKKKKKKKKKTNCASETNAGELLVLDYEPSLPTLLNFVPVSMLPRAVFSLFKCSMLRHYLRTYGGFHCAGSSDVLAAQVPVNGATTISQRWKRKRFLSQPPHYEGMLCWTLLVSTPSLVLFLAT